LKAQRTACKGSKSRSLATPDIYFRYISGLSRLCCRWPE